MTLRNSSNFIYTRSLWIFTYLLDISQEDLDLLPAKLENLEDLAWGPAFLLINRVCQLQDPGNTLMAFPHLKRLCIFHADDQSLARLPIISVPVTQLHLIRPTARFINIILSNIPPSLHCVTSICLEAITPNIPLSFSPEHVSTLLRVLPSNTSIIVKLSIYNCLPAEVEQFQTLSANNPRLLVKLNTIRPYISSVKAGSMVGRRILDAVDEASNEWA